MASTDHIFGTEGSSGTTTESLAAPSVLLSIYEYDIGGDLEDRLLYVDQRQTDHKRYDETAFIVPSNYITACVVFKWKGGGVNPKISVTGQPSVDLFVDDVLERTTAVFPIPQEEHAHFEWAIKGGSPGFKLAVKVRRKA